jgi:predicted O-linked N-acetylglucosamine transferase (SPINDLY family)
MSNYEERFNIAKQLHSSGRIEESQKIYLDLAKIYKNNYTLFYLIGTTFLQLKKFDDAIDNFHTSIDINSNFPEVYNNLGIALAEKEKYSEALENYNKAIKLKNDYIDAHINRGVSLNKLKKFQDAISDLNFVIKTQPLNPLAHNNLGNIFKELKNYNEAINSYDKAININQNYLEAINNKALILNFQKKYENSLKELNKIYNKNPEFHNLLQNIISNKMHIFDWENFDDLTKLMKESILANKFYIDPLLIYYLFDNPELQKNNSYNFINDKFKNFSKTILKNNKTKNDKIKIGYFSGDFYDHPVFHTMANIFKNHNKSNFEIYGFSHTPIKKGNLWKESVIGYFKKFYEINNMSDESIFRLVEKEKIDIAIDLTGLTKYSRTSIFYNRIAPIQISYLGYPGTMGLKSMDYIIADSIVIPKTDKKNYFEKVVYLPKCYIPCSKDLFSKKSNKKFSRSEFNLPEKEIVFCAFHNPLKINPTIFNVWIKILKRTKKSVLWIKSNNEAAKRNLKYQAKKGGLNPERIVFAKNIVNKSDHIERLKLADIFLDAYPYNSHSTIYDYLKANLPMIIKEGASFPSRVGSSVYSSIGLKELVAKSNLDYEGIAVDLANNKSKLIKLKNKIQNQIKDNYLFDDKKFTEDLEKVYLEIFNKKT